MKYSNPLNLWWIGLRKQIFITINILLIFGILVNLSVGSSASEKIMINNGTLFFFKQIVFCTIGYIIMLILSNKDIDANVKIGYIGLFISLAMLIIVPFMHVSVKGAKRWIHIAHLTIQPSEILKPFFIIVMSHLMTLFNIDSIGHSIMENFKKYKYYVYIVLLYVVTCILLFLEPDFGMVLTFTVITITILYLSNISIKKILIIGFIGFIAISISALSFEHVRFRVKNFLDSKHGDNYQTNLATNAIQDGELFGVGFGESKLKFVLPDAHNDFIFAIVCEEFGSILALILILLYLIIVYNCFLYVIEEEENLRHITNTRDIYQIVLSRNIVISGIMLIFFEACINSSVSLHLIPTKGMTLPFISYGGSSLISHLILVGFLLSITRKKYRNVIY